MQKQNVVRLLDRVKWFGLRKLYWLLMDSSVSIKEFFISLGFFPETHQSLIKRSASKMLIEAYDGDWEGHNLNTKQYFLGFGLIHYAFIRNMKPKNILCIGSLKGFIPAILALACKDNGHGHVDFVDAGFGESDIGKNWGGIGFWKTINPTQHFSRIAVSDYITTHVMTTKEFAKQNTKKRYQYIYIDGDHSYEGVKLDYSLFWPHLDTHGFMAFHDVVATGYMNKGKFGVQKLWKEIIAKKHGILFPFPKHSGLGIVQKI